jgi:hypothetical protein
MTLAKRLENVEDHNLTPREAVILWIREAHEFGCLLDYGYWLAEQPDDAFPLIKMPAQVVAAVRARNKATPDAKLQDEFYRVQKDVLFLYHLHKQVNLRALLQEEAYQLKLSLIAEKLRAIVLIAYSVDRERVDNLECPEDLSHPLPKREKTRQELVLEEEILEWPSDEALLWAEVTSFQEAERLVSKRYLAGEPLFYPDSAQKLAATLAALRGLRDTYDSVLDGRPPDADEDFIRWLARERDPKETVGALPPVPPDHVRPRTRASALAIAQHFILMARAEALDDLDERDAGISLVQKWMRSEEGRLRS